MMFSLRARATSFRYAWRGVGRLLRTEHNAWLHLAVTVSVAVSGVWLHVGIEEWRWLILAAAFVWVAEALNTALEELCDRLHPGHDPAIGAVKDLAAGAVLLASTAASMIGLMTLGPPALRLLA